MSSQPANRVAVSLLATFLTVSCGSLGGSKSSDSTRFHEVSAAQRTQEAELMFRVLAGEIAGHLGDLEQSVSHYSQAATLTEDPKVADRATRIALYAEDTESALSAAKRWVELAPDNPEARQTLAILYIRNGQSDQAVPHLEYMVEYVNQAAKGEEGRGFLVVGATLAKEKDVDAALEAMQHLLERHPDSAQAHFAYANLALSAQRFQLAADESKKALALDPDHIEARTVRARALLQLGNDTLALEEMKSAVKANPESRELRVNYGRMLVQAKEYQQARAVFEELLEEQPDNTDLLYMLGLLNLQDQQYEAAEQTFKRLVDTGKRKNEGYYYLGRVAEVREQHKDATDYYLKVGEGDYFLDAQIRVADTYLKLGSLEKARTHLKNLREEIADSDTTIKLYLAEGQLLREAGRFHEGMAVYNRALTEHPSNGDLLYARALMAEKLDRIDLLEADLRAILADDPDNATALNALGYTLADRNERIPEAYEYIQRALEARPDDPMGWVQYRMGNYTEAEQYLRKAYGLLQDAEIAGHLSEIIWVQGNKAEARDLLKRALEKDPEHGYLLKLKHRFSQ